ncbi:hypothetical protein GN316_03260 [Xylophilus sp. Kf1]|nr:hypothetical protein [Xylophilus sp. Kf1]
MKTAVDIAEDFTDEIFQALLRSDTVRQALPAGTVGKRRRHVIDAAGFDTDGSVMFDGEFDIHYGARGDAPGHPALRVHVEGHLEKAADGDWTVRRLAVENLQSVDAVRGPDELAS